MGDEQTIKIDHRLPQVESRTDIEKTPDIEEVDSSLEVRKIFDDIERDMVAHDRVMADAVDEFRKCVELYRSMRDEMTGDYAMYDDTEPLDTMTTQDMLRDTLKEVDIIGFTDIYRVLEFVTREMVRIDTKIKKSEQIREERALEREQLLSKRAEIIDKIKTEQNKNFFSRMFNFGQIRILESEMSDLTDKISNLDNSTIIPMDTHNSSSFDLKVIGGMRAELMVKFIEKLFSESTEVYYKLTERLTDPVIKRELNKKLLDAIIEKNLLEMEREGEMSREDVEEYIPLLKRYLELTDLSDSERTEDIDKESKAIDHKINKFVKKSSVFNELISKIKKTKNGADDGKYDKIFDLLIRRKTKDKIEEVYEMLDGDDFDLFGMSIKSIFERTISPTYNKDNTGFNLDELPGDIYRRLDGMERWDVIRGSEGIRRLISEEMISEVGGSIVRGIYRAGFVHRGTDLYRGIDEAIKLRGMGDPRALPLLLGYVEKTGSNHVTNLVVQQIESIMVECDQDDLQSVLTEMPSDKRIILESLVDPTSYIYKFGRLNSRYVTATLIHDGEKTLKMESYTRLLEKDGLAEKDLQDFYLMTGDRDSLMTNLIRSAKLDSTDSREVVGEFTKELMKYISPSNFSIDYIRRLSEESGQSPQELSSSIKEKLHGGRVEDPVMFLKSLKELAVFLKVDSKELIIEFFDDLLQTISPSKIDVQLFRELSKESGKSPREVFDHVKDRLSGSVLGDVSEFIESLKFLAEFVGVDSREMIFEFIDNIKFRVGPGNPDSMKIIDEVVESTKSTRAEILLIFFDGLTQIPRNSLLRQLLSPKDGDYASFPMLVAEKKFGLGGESLAKLGSIYESKLLQSSNFAREVIFEGVVSLMRDTGGKDVMDRLLASFRGSKDDPSRLRRTFQMMKTLRGFGMHGGDEGDYFVVPDSGEISAKEEELQKLKDGQVDIIDKNKKKNIKTQIRRLETEVQDLTGLKGIEETMTKKVVEEVCKKLGLSEKHREKVRDNIDELMGDDIFQIGPALVSQYEAKGAMQSKELLKTVILHIVDGDFKSWRYSHELSGIQLAGLTEEQKSFWKENMPPVTIKNELSISEKENRDSQLKTVKEMIANAKEHILMTLPEFDFGDDKLAELQKKLEEITKKIISAGSKEEKQKLIQEKEVLQAEETIIRLFKNIDSQDESEFTKEIISRQVRELIESTQRLELPLALLDLMQVEKVFTVGDVGSVSAFESDDALTLLKVGTEPQETCQSWRSGGYNECLMAYVADSNKKVINVVDNNKSVIARSVIKLTKYIKKMEDGSSVEKSTLLVEPLYSVVKNDEVYRAFARVLFAKARGLDSAISFGRFPDQSMLETISEEATSFGYNISESGFTGLFIPKSMNNAEYSDSMGGKKTSFGIYTGVNGVTFDRA